MFVSASRQFRKIRYPVEMILDLLAAGMTFDELLEDYSDLERKIFKPVCCLREN
jgi:uncharacterized protein (DUF433 family)